MKLSERAVLLLQIINNETDKDWDTGETRRYFCPDAYGNWWNHARVQISGAGDANALKGLERKGLTETPKGSGIPYAYVITELGRLILQERGLL